jgi:2-polyprenyl-3-methyl-5-hydroxy-6-metoxy-1,4-benzoquinol methylase
VSLATEYDQWHQRVFDSAPEHRDGESPWYNLVLEYLPPVKGKRVLEIACGRGGFAGLLASKGASMFGADFSETALRIAQKKSPRDCDGDILLSLAQADAQRLPYASESFDIVISCETIEHLPDPLSALKEMARVCRTGGLLYLTTPNYFNAMGLYCVYARLRGRRATPGSDQPFDRVFLFPEVRRMLKSAGWDIVRTDGTVHQFPFPGREPGRWRAIERSRLVRRWLGAFALHQFLMARKRIA